MNNKTTIIAAAISGLLLGASACASKTPEAQPAAPAAGEKQACKGHEGEDKNHCKEAGGEKASCSGDKGSCKGH